MTENEALIDAMAQAMFAHEWREYATWDGTDESDRCYWRVAARAALAALLSLPVEERARALGFEQVAVGCCDADLTDNEWIFEDVGVGPSPPWVPLYAPLPDRSQEP